MTDHQTSVLRSRLHRLADDMTPALDVVGQVRDARTRHGRQRRGRITMVLVATAAAAAVVAVPLTTGALNSSAPDGGVAVPGGGDSDQRRSERLDRTESNRRLTDERLAAGADQLAALLETRDAPLSLTAPADPIECPADTGTLSDALGIRLDYLDNSLPQGACEWTADGPIEDYVHVGIGFLTDYTEHDVSNGITVDEGCLRTSLLSFTPTAVLDACSLDGHSEWTLYVPDAGGAGVWGFVAVVGDNAAGDGPTALAAVIDVAADTW